MATYFSTKKRLPIPTGIATEELFEKVVDKVGDIANTASILAATHPNEDNKLAAKLLADCKLNLFRALTPKQVVTEQPPATTPTLTIK